MSIFTRLKEKQVMMHLITALLISVVLFMVGLVFGEYREWCLKGVELCLASVIDFLLFGSIE